MNQLETFWLRKIIFLSMAILTLVSSMAIVRPAFAQVAPANFDEIDDYISARMKELGIPGAALVIVQGDQIVHLRAFGVADADASAMITVRQLLNQVSGVKILTLWRRISRFKR